MMENSKNNGSNELSAWKRARLDEAVEEISSHGILQDVLVEARPAWTLPLRIMIGQVRDSGDPSNSQWFICGEIPTDYIDSAVAKTPQEAARHFALKWQLDAARYQDPSVQKTLGLDPAQDWDKFSNKLAEQAESLYALVEDQNLW